ncbi:PTS sugar transporter subunit IIC [Paenibacillus apiarius]|uniref:Permease IIC component n=1 Tax=Paenibacillus apiarius TaxID=46240 RepID=A0ABT4DW74_9BACL|nr:PTS transporter subunit EIIC [Paenibacillus apiarius]MCY9513063.1 PTS transporter subunit EIIC [Paenibacillus apiarius]MCY9521579.1 PTS transporter subunit EIIC [Paenibacillus apiarius]MCY9551733.1 PTS transporter subunit EIIC [Paenibacillus apiarius]MCY9560479.1 PTS transporter subunit EIIC [Paenibacillus apiarius]MCY9685271.1 PTS transporter subunit EIIC [Paenibacillus apiarius]
MDRLMKWMTEKFAPRLEAFTKNVWVDSIQEAIMVALPMIFIGSLITLVSILNNYFPGMPDLTPITTFSFGLLGIFIAFLTPYMVMQKKDRHKIKLIAGATGLSLFMMLLKPKISDDGTIQFLLERFGPSGMITALLVGILVALVMNMFNRFSWFKKDTKLPEFIVDWFDFLVPIGLILMFGWVLIYQLDFDIFELIVNVFKPLNTISQSLAGFVLFNFIGVVLYSFGVSPWVMTPIFYSIWIPAIEENAALAAQGLEPVNINTFETFFSGWVGVGGLGATLPLIIWFLFAKSKKLNSIGKATIVPSLFNINEPVIYGAPIAFNPILMIPMWINGLITPIIVYMVLDSGLVDIPAKVYQLWYTPIGLSTYILSGLKGLILLAVVLLIIFVVWFPFFKVYDLQELKKEKERADLQEG